MTVQLYCQLLPGAKYGKNDQEWFPKWLRRYAAGQNAIGNLPVTTSSVVAFSQSLLKSNTPAWQRLQAVRALECYRDLVCGSEEPHLNDMKTVLHDLVAREKDGDEFLSTVGGAIPEEVGSGGEKWEV